MVCEELFRIIDSNSRINVFGTTFWGCLVAQMAVAKGKHCCFTDYDKEKHSKSVINGIMCVSPYDIDPEAMYIIAVHDNNIILLIISFLIGRGVRKVYTLDPEIMVQFERVVDDETYLKAIFYETFDRELNLKHPKTYNEKLQWIKLHDRRADYIMMADKYRVKEYVGKKIGDEYVIPTIGVWNEAREIPFDKLPNRFVLKCNHDSGGIIVCKDRSIIDFDSTIVFLEEHMNRNYYWIGREWVYKNIEPKIIAEEYMEDKETQELRDYKFFCFDGVPRFVQVDFDRFTDHKRNIYDMNWNHMDFELLYPSNPKTDITRPKDFELMTDIAGKLSEGIPHVRVDLYYVNDHVYFGELTLYPESGLGYFKPTEYDELFGSYITLI